MLPDDASLAARALAPRRPRLADALAVVAPPRPDDAAPPVVADALAAAPQDPAAAWEALAARGVIPLAWVGDPARAFADRRCAACGAVVDSLDHACRDPSRVVVTRVATPPTLAAALALACDPAGVATAESLAREVAARLAPWGAPGADGVAWVVTRPPHPPCARGGCFRAAARAARAALAQASPRPPRRALADPPDVARWGTPATRGLALAAWAVDLDAARDWALAAARGLRVPPDAGAPEALAGVAFAALPAPFEPLVALWSSGYALADLDAGGAVLVAPCPDADAPRALPPEAWTPSPWAASAARATAAPSARRVRFADARGDDDAARDLPLRVLAVGDWWGRPDPRPVDARTPVALDRDTFDRALEGQSLDLALAGEGLAPGDRAVYLRPRRLAHLAPEAIARRVPALHDLLALAACVDAARGPLGGVTALVRRVRALVTDEAARERYLDDDGGALLAALVAESRLAPEGLPVDAVARGYAALVTALFEVDPEALRAAAPVPFYARLGDVRAALDARLAGYVRAILRHPDFQRLEAGWRSLRYLVDAFDFREDVTLEALNVSQGDAALDLEDSPSPSWSGLYRRVAGAVARGEAPYGLVVTDYVFSPAAGDVALLGGLATLAAAAQAPLLAAAAPATAGVASWRPLAGTTDLGGRVRAAEGDALRALRARPEARYVGLCLPRVPLRAPYGADAAPVRAFALEEGDAAPLLGSAALALAACAAQAFARDRWCTNILGPDDGVAPGLPLGPRGLELNLSDREEYELFDAGLVPLTYVHGRGEACFFSAASCHRVARAAPLDMLAYTFLVARVAHHVMVVARRVLADDAAATRAALERALADWLALHASAADLPPRQRASRPLRSARVAVVEDAGRPGAFGCRLEVTPARMFLGAPFTLAADFPLGRGMLPP